MDASCGRVCLLLLSIVSALFPALRAHEFVCRVIPHVHLLVAVAGVIFARLSIDYGVHHFHDAVEKCNAGLWQSRRSHDSGRLHYGAIQRLIEALRAANRLFSNMVAGMPFALLAFKQNAKRHQNVVSNWDYVRLR